MYVKGNYDAIKEDLNIDWEEELRWTKNGTSSQRKYKANKSGKLKYKTQLGKDSSQYKEEAFHLEKIYGV